MSSQNDDDDDDDQNDIHYPQNHRYRCCFIPLPRFRTTSSYALFHPIKPHPTTITIGNNPPWWLRGWNKLRSVSEVVFGPKWKTFIRRFGRNRLLIKAGASSFQYDPISYKLNFDDGEGEDGDQDYCNRKSFSTRFAPVPGNTSVQSGNSGPSV